MNRKLPGSLCVIRHEPTDLRHALAHRQLVSVKRRIETPSKGFKSSLQSISFEFWKCRCSRENCFGGDDCKHNSGCEMQVHARPLGKVHFPFCQTLKAFEGLFVVVLSSGPVLPHAGFEYQRCIRVKADRHEFVDLFEARRCIHQVVHVRGHEQSVHSAPDKSPLYRWREHCRKHSSHRADGCPSIPVHNTLFAEPPALTHTVKYRHNDPLSLLERILP